MSATKHDGTIEQMELEPLNENGDNIIISETGPRYQRDVWESKTVYLLFFVGNIIGLGGIWRFPYLCYTNGGVAFLIPYCVCMILVGFPLFYLELSLGSFSGKSSLVVWNLCPIFKGIGYTMFILSFGTSWYHGTLIAWVLYYLGYSFSSTPPWSSCLNDWNAAVCVNDGAYNSIANYTGIPETAATQFWKNKVLHESPGIDDLGTIQWPLVLVLFLSHSVAFLCIIKSVRSVGKVVWVTSIMPYVLLTVLFVRCLFLEGAMEGIKHYVHVNTDKLAKWQVWVSALYEVIHTLGIAYGGILTMASHNGFRSNSFWDGVFCIVVKVMTVYSCGLVIFAIIGVAAHQSERPIYYIVSAGPSLVFEIVPEALSQIPVSQLWTVLFFFLLLFIAVNNQLGMIQTVVSGLTDMFPKFLGKRKLLLLLLVFVFYFKTSLIFATQAGKHILYFIDWYFGSCTVLLMLIMECIIIGWFYGAERFGRDIKIMTGRVLFMPIRWLWCIFVPVGMFILLVHTLKEFRHISSSIPNQYPDYMDTIGILIMVIPVIPVPVFMGWEIISALMRNRISYITRPPSDWGPNDVAERRTYQVHKYRNNIAYIVLDNLFGKTIST